MSWRHPYSFGELTVPQQDLARMEFLDSDDLDAEAAQQREDRIADYTPAPSWASEGALLATRSPRAGLPRPRGTGAQLGADHLPTR